VWFFFTLYFVVLTAFVGGSSRGTLFPNITIFVVLSLLLNLVISGGILLVFLAIFLAFWEKRRSLKDIFSSVGLKKEGSAKSMFWSLVLFPLCLAVGLIMMVFSYFLGPIPFSNAFVSRSGKSPVWYLYYMIINAFFPTAIVEEAVGRGYMLDRLMPQHPSSLVKSFPAILLSSLLFTFWHLPSYLRVYSFSLPWTLALLAGNVFPLSVVLSIAYVRSRTRNIAGPVLIHFLLDSMTVFLLLFQ
jgi:membrane protease YdiL (CAAX protease family)